MDPLLIYLILQMFDMTSTNVDSCPNKLPLTQCPCSNSFVNFLQAADSYLKGVYCNLNQELFDLFRYTKDNCCSIVQVDVMRCTMLSVTASYSIIDLYLAKTSAMYSNLDVLLVTQSLVANCFNTPHEPELVFTSPQDLHILNLKWLQLPAQQLKSRFHVPYFLLMYKKVELVADQTRWALLLLGLCCADGLVDENRNMHTVEQNLSTCPLLLSKLLVQVLVEC